jgi:hypothetical protein
MHCSTLLEFAQFLLARGSKATGNPPGTEARPVGKGNRKIPGREKKHGASGDTAEPGTSPTRKPVRLSRVA